MLIIPRRGTLPFSWNFSGGYDYSWIWSSLNFAVTVMMGVFAGKLIKSGYKSDANRVFRQLIYIGLGCVLLGWGFGYQMPIVKRIWTSSFTLFTGGICFLLMALFFYIIDIKQYKRPFVWLKIFGMNSIVAYFLGEFINFRPIVHRFTYGIENILPEYKVFILTSGHVFVIFLILYLLYKNKVFVKT